MGKVGDDGRFTSRMNKTDALKVSNIEKLLQIDSTIRSDSRSANWHHVTLKMVRLHKTCNCC